MLLPYSITGAAYHRWAVITFTDHCVLFGAQILMIPWHGNACVWNHTKYGTYEILTQECAYLDYKQSVEILFIGINWILVWICGHEKVNWMDLTLHLVDPFEEVSVISQLQTGMLIIPHCNPSFTSLLKPTESSPITTDNVWIYTFYQISKWVGVMRL